MEDVAALRAFPFTGQGVLVGKRIRAWQHGEGLMALFGKTLLEARRNLQSHVSKWSTKGRCIDEKELASRSKHFKVAHARPVIICVAIIGFSIS